MSEFTYSPCTLHHQRQTLKLHYSHNIPQQTPSSKPFSTPHLKINMPKANPEATPSKGNNSAPRNSKSTATKPTASKVTKTAPKKANGIGPARQKLPLQERYRGNQNGQPAALFSAATTTTTTTTTTAAATTTTTTTATADSSPQSLTAREDDSGDETLTDNETVSSTPLTSLPEEDQVYQAARILFKMAHSKE
jgi:hypothetical protein